LHWARTILHEAAHAYFVATVYNNLEDPEQRDIDLGVTSWADAMANNNHDWIANRYLDPIAQSLYEFGQSKNYRMQLSYYRKLAWGGLLETDLFEGLSKEEQDEIKDVNKIESDGHDSKGYTATQRGTKSGC
jgi:hypothetical protein